MPCICETLANIKGQFATVYETTANTYLVRLCDETRIGTPAIATLRTRDRDLALQQMDALAFSIYPPCRQPVHYIDQYAA